MSSFDDLKARQPVPFASIHLDPNNPRISPDPAPGYDDPDKIFKREIQDELTKEVYRIYRAEALERAIVAQGWTPIDPVIVWAHPKHPEGHIVVEGNTRVSVLRNIRKRLPSEQAKLEKMESSGRYKTDELEEQRHLVKQLDGVIADTERLEVVCVRAGTVAELEEKLPKLLGVRHILGTRNWTPYATNLYILSLYERAFRVEYSDKVKLRLEPELIRVVADLVSLTESETRQAIQAASAFGHFKRRFEDQVAHRVTASRPRGFGDDDQYFFVNILDSKYARTQLGFGPSDLKLPPESEDALFTWAFMKDPPQGEHVFKKAEDIRAWQSLSRYDVNAKTGFAAQIDVDKPEEALPIEELQSQQRQHKKQQTPIKKLQELIDVLHELPGETIRTQAAHLEPMLEEIAVKVQGFRDMIAGVTGSTNKAA